MARHDPYAALRVLNFRWFVASLMAMTIATQIQAVVVAWQIYELTHDPLSLGLIGLAEAVPFIGVALFAGHVADRVSRVRISLIALAALFVCSVALLGFTLVPGIITPARVWPIYLVIFLSGIARSFLQPARSALGAELVPRELYPNAVTWRSSTWQFATVVGPAVGGLVYGFGSASLAYALDAVIMGISVVALLPVFAAEILHVGPQGLGILRAAPAVGAVTMSVLLAHLPPLRRAGRTLLYSVALFGLCMIGFGLSRNFLLSIALLGASGMADTVSVVVRSTLLQVLTPTYLLGRVSAVNAIFIGSSNEIGAFESGTAARLIGTVPAVVLGGMATLVVVAITAVKVPSLRRLGRIEELGAGS